MQSVDFYCERVAPGFGGEPFNTLTGLAFLVVGLWALRRAPAVEDRLAALALALVGAFSALQHAAALSHTVLADMAANLLFLLALGVLLLRRLAAAGPLAAFVGAAVAVVAAGSLARSPTAWAMIGPGADMFSLLTAVLVVAAAALLRTRPIVARSVFASALLLAGGLPFRFLDAAACAVWPLGTHGIWHLFNAAAMAVLLAALARASAAPLAGQPWR